MKHDNAESPGFWTALAVVFRNRGLLAATMMLVLVGFADAATQPYESIIGVVELGLPEPVFAMLFFASMVVTTVTSLILGSLSDLLDDPRVLPRALVAVGIVGYLGFYVWATPAMFAVAVLALLPLSYALYFVLFGQIRATTESMRSGTAGAVNALARAAYAGAWVVVPGLMGLWLVVRPRVSETWGIAGLALTLALLASLLLPGPSEPTTRAKSRPPSKGIARQIFEPLRLLLARNVWLPVVSVGVVVAAHRLGMVLAPLQITQVIGGTTTDVGLVAGAVALGEIPAMLLWGGLVVRRGSAWVLAVGTGLFCLYLFGLGMATELWHLYALVVPQAVGAAAILSVPLTYLQDVMPDRPGLGSSLVSVSTMLGFGVASMVFGSGTWVGIEYPGVALCGAALAAVGALLMLAAAKRQGARTR